MEWPLVSFAPAPRAGYFTEPVQLGFGSFNIMSRLSLTIIALLVSLSAARADNTEFHISSTNLDTLLYSFSVSTNATDAGVAFHVIITHKRFDIYPDSSADVGTIKHKEITNATARAPGPIIQTQTSFEALKPAIPIALKKEKRVWTADFTASRELLKNPDLCFVFAVPGLERTRGKTEPPLEDLYELKLQDFAKP